MFQKPNRAVSKVFIHCSASQNPNHDNIAMIRKWHTSPDPKDPSKPWVDVGYHYFIRSDGTIELGRSLEMTPAAQGGYNRGSIAICLHGLDVGDFTEAQRKALHELCTRINIEYKGSITFHGHKEVNPHKDCPVFDYKEWLRLDEFGRMPLPQEEKEKCIKDYSTLSQVSSLSPSQRSQQLPKKTGLLSTLLNLLRQLLQR